MKKRILSLLTCLALCLTLLPVTTLAANTVSYIYYQWNENTQTLSGPIDGTAATATEVTASDTAWDSNTTGSWYVAQSDVTINQRVTVTGEVYLILADGCTLTVNGGIQVAENNSLTIYGQSGGTGKLIATLTGGSYNAAIGGNGQEGKNASTGGIGAPGGTVTIHGGTVTAQSHFGAGIGGGSGWSSGAGGTVTIYGGTVTASSDGGAGIGGGGNNWENSYGTIIGGTAGAGGTVTIHGGTVTAKGGNLGAGIGGGSGNAAGAGGTVTITGGTVTAQGDLGAGIGGGNGDTGGAGGTVTITGGTVTATGDLGAGIGGGSSPTRGAGGTVTITGGTVTATSKDGAGIGSGYVNNSLGYAGTFSTSENGTNGNAVIFASGKDGEAIQADDDTTGWRGVIFQGDSGLVYGTPVTPTEDFTIPSGKTLTIEDGKTLTIPEGVTLTNEGTLTVSEGGTLTVSEGGKLTVEQGGTLTGSVNGSTPPTISGQPTDQTVTEGSTATFTVTASAGEDENTDTLTYQWQQSTGSGGTWTDISGATSASYTTKATTTSMSGDQYRCVVTGAASRVSVVSSAAALTVTAKPTYTITVSQTAGGTATADKTTAAAGETVTLAATPDSGYHFDGWNVASNNVTIQDNQFTMPAGNVEIQAIFARNSSGSSDPTYSVSLPSQVTGGELKLSRRYAEKGETVTLTAIPDEGYELDTLMVTDSKGKEIDLTHKGGNEYTFKMPAGRVEIEVSFREIEVELPFTDVPEGAWYEDAAAYVYEHGLMAGTSTTTFAPDATTSRSMIATILWRMAGSPVVNYAMDYTDVAQGQWYSEAIRWAASEGIVGGYGNGLFGTNDPITREQFAAMLYRFAQEQGYDVSIGENTNILSYTDVADLSEYAISAMQWAVGTGIITGTGDGSTLSPQGQATRAEAAVMLTRYCENVAKQ